MEQTVGVPCKTQHETTAATYHPDTILSLLKVMHGRLIVPTGLDATKYPLALNEKLLQQEQERTSIAVAARFYSYEVGVLFNSLFGKKNALPCSNIVHAEAARGAFAMKEYQKGDLIGCLLYTSDAADE